MYKKYTDYFSAPSVISETVTENGAPSHDTANNHCLDLFFALPSFRSEAHYNINHKYKNSETLVSHRNPERNSSPSNFQSGDLHTLFKKAFDQNPVLAIRILYWARDARFGAGERSIFRSIITAFSAYPPFCDLYLNNSHLVEMIPFYGRWDDLFSLFNTPLEEQALNLIKNTLIGFSPLVNESNSKNALLAKMTYSTAPLCAKWMPREKSSNKEKRLIAEKIRKHLSWSKKRYRKILSHLTKQANAVEQKICANQWEQIDYSSVSSKAMLLYRKAFKKHSPEKFSNFCKKLQQSKATVNSRVLYPHEIVAPFLEEAESNHAYCPIRFSTSIDSTTSLSEEEKSLLNAQWDCLPNFFSNTTNEILPVVDTSGSMYSNNNLPIKAAISLGIYISERNEGAFKNSFITFSDFPEIQRIPDGDLSQKVAFLSTANWGHNTNLEKVFLLVLKAAKRRALLHEDMPSIILILSDMHFDRACSHPNKTLFKTIETLYEEAGYPLPRIIFWNLAARKTTFPVTSHQTGTALISGFSPSILKNFFKTNKLMTPQSIMENTVHDSRYSDHILPLL